MLKPTSHGDPTVKNAVTEFHESSPMFAKKQALIEPIFIDQLVEIPTLVCPSFPPENPERPLAGVPVAVKNNVAVQGTLTRAGSRVFEDEPAATTDARVVSELRVAGAQIVATTNMNELAYGFTGKNEPFGDVPNPWYPDHMSGGSSSGSAAAIAAGLVPIAIGTDTNGSIRVPASLCGIWGLRPTAGQVSTEAIVPLAPTLDTAGPLASTAEFLSAAARVIDATLHDTRNTSSNRLLVTATVKGFPNNWVQPAVATAVDRVARHLGATREICLPLAEATRSAAQILTAVEGAATHIHHLRHHAHRIGPTTRHRLLAGALVPGHFYVRAQSLRVKAKQEFLAAMADIDLLVAPATPCTAPLLVDEVVRFDGYEEHVNAALGRCTTPFSFVGFPSLVAPITDTGDLPLGVQLIAKPGQDHLLLDIASELEVAGICQAKVHD